MGNLHEIMNIYKYSLQYPYNDDDTHVLQYGMLVHEIANVMVNEEVVKQYTAHNSFTITR